MRTESRSVKRELLSVKRESASGRGEVLNVRR